MHLWVFKKEELPPEQPASIPEEAQPADPSLPTGMVQIADVLKLTDEMKLPTPLPNTANIEKLRLDSEIEITSRCSNPTAARVRWRNIWFATSIEDPGDHHGQSNLDAKIHKAITTMARGDLRRAINDNNAKLHRENKPLLNGQQVVWKMYESLKGITTEKRIHDINKFWNVKIHDGDLRSFDRDWDLALDECAGWNSIEDQQMLRTLYMAQVRDHPLLRQHMANWTLLDDSERSYKWLRDVVKRVLHEQHIIHNDKAWQALRDQQHQHYVADASPFKFKQGMCKNWYEYGRCIIPNCGLKHEGPDAASVGAGLPASQNAAQRHRPNPRDRTQCSSQRNLSQRSNRSNRSNR